MDARQADVDELRDQARTELDLGTLMQRAVVLAANGLSVELSQIAELGPDGKWSRVRASAESTRAQKGEGSGPTRNILSVVIPGEDAPFGVLRAHTTEDRAFTQEDFRYLHDLANVLGGAVRRKQEVEHPTFFRSLIERVSSVVIVCGADGRIQYVSPSVKRLGYTPEECGSTSCFALAHASDAAFLQDALRRAVERAGAVPPFTLRLRDKAGRWRCFEATATSMKAETVVVTAHELAGENRESPPEFPDSEERLRQAQRMEAIGRLAGGIAHDFNNLLTVILGTTELILNQANCDSTIREDVVQIRKAAERAATLTGQLLAFSRRQVLHPQVLDLNAVVGNLQQMLPRLIGEDIELVTVLDPTLGRIKADPGQIDQVVLNLAVNARDAMPQGGKLIIETANVELDEEYAARHVAVGPGPYVMLAMTDAGIGMDAETQRHVFEPFFTTKSPGSGTGLGLATVYGIVKQSEGNIWVYSEIGKGTTFKVYLPRVKDAADASPSTEPGAQAPGGDETILIVEDDDGLRSLASRILEAHGYRVLTARSGDEALGLSRHHEGPIHLLATDVVMPHMSGADLARQLGISRPDMRVLYLSGYTGEALGRRGVLEQETAFLQKPFSQSDLLRRVREALDARANR